MNNEGIYIIKSNKAITLISLIITIILLIILATVVINITLGKNGLFSKAKYAKEETLKQTATEKLNLKITNTQINIFSREQRMPTLQELANDFCEDDEIEYVELESKRVGSLEKIELGEKNSFFTKLKEYPYEFEINSSFELASIDGLKTENNSTNTNLNIDDFKNFNEIFKADNSGATISEYNYTLEKDYKFIIIIASAIGTNSDSYNAYTAINVNNTQNDIIKLINNERHAYENSKYFSSVTMAYMIKPNKGTTITGSIGFRGRIHIYALGN